MQGIGNGVVTVLVAVIGLATIAAIVSRRADTANIVDRALSGTSNLIGSALSPITGGSVGQGIGAW